MTNKAGRNDHCPCGSGKKYKKCCLEKDEAGVRVQAGTPPSPQSAHSQREDDGYEDLQPLNICKTMADEKESEESDEKSLPEEESLRYPKLDMTLPKLSPEQEALGKAWWKEIDPYFKKNDADEMLRRVVRFMEEHPELFVHLGLEHEFLFELGAELGRRQQWSRQAELLRRIRNEHPEMYVRAFSYYDRDLIIEHVATGQAQDVSRFFNFFHQYPDSEPDNVKEIVEFLAWTGNDEALLDFVRPLAVPMWISPDVIGGWLCLHWLILAEYVPFLNSNEDSRVCAEQVQARITAMALPREVEMDVDLIHRDIDCFRSTRAPPDFSLCRTAEDIFRFYQDTAWNYAGFLCRSGSFSWTRAFFLKERLTDYWLDVPKGKKANEPFQFDEGRLDRHIARHCRQFFGIDGVKATALLQAIWHFADYLRANDRLDGETVEQVHRISSQLFERCRKAVDSTDPAPRLVSEFPNFAVTPGYTSVERTFFIARENTSRFHAPPP